MTAASARDAPSTGDRYRVLIVDDEPDLRAYARECLAALPYVDVELAASGEDAVAALERGWFDVVLSDQRMGRVSGVETLAKARALAPDAPRVLMTAFGDLTLAEEAVNSGHVTRFLSKPFLPDDLVDLVAPLLTTRRAAQHRRVAFERALTPS